MIKMRKILAFFIVVVLVVTCNPTMAITAFAEARNNVASVSLSDFHSAAVTTNGDLYCWGVYEQVGNGISTNQLTPVKVLENVASVSLSSEHSAAVTTSGDLYCWGDNSCGQIGNGTTTDQLTPVKVLENVTSVSLGDRYSAAVTANGDLYCWGYNSRGQIGNGTTTNQLTPVKVLENVASISLSYENSAAVTTNGDLYCWGDNSCGQIGNGTTTTTQLTPVKVLENVASISLSYENSAAVTTNGDLYCWGYNWYGQIGNGTTTNQLMPVKILENVASISLGAGNPHSAAVTTNGDLYCWGCNWSGQIGNGTTTNQLMPVKILENVASISLGEDCSAAVTTNGDLYCWGLNDGRIGNGTIETQLTPVKVLENVTSVSLGYHHSAAVTTNGDLYCWGYNRYGQVGNSTTTDQLTPVKINLSSDDTELPGEGDDTGEDDKMATNGSLTTKNAITITSGEMTSLPVTIQATTGEEVKTLFSSLQVQSKDTSIATAELSSLSQIEPTTWGTSHTVYVDVTGYVPGTTDIVISTSDGSTVTCKATVTLEQLEPETTYRAGTLQNVDEGSMKVTISGTVYDVTDDFDMSKATTIFNDKECKTVAITLRNGYISEMVSVEDIMNPSLRLEMAPQQITYSGGAYSQTEGTVNAILSCEATAPYNAIDFSGLDVPTVHFSNLQLGTSSQLYFEKNLLGNKVTTKEEIIDETLRLGENRSYMYGIHLDASAGPEGVNGSAHINATAQMDSNVLTAQGMIAIGNLDLQREKAEDKNINLSSKKNVEEAQNTFSSNELGVAIDVGFLSNYLSTTTIADVQKCIKAWIADLISVRSIVNEDETGIIAQIEKQAKIKEQELVSELLASAGVNDGLLTKQTKSKASTEIYTYDKNGNAVTLYVTFDMGYYAFKDDPPYGGFGTITLYLEDAAGMKHKNMANGLVTYADMPTFINKLKSVAESSIKSVYSDAWGSDANKVVEILVGETITKIVKDAGYSFSDGVFKLLESPTKHYLKEVSGHCPVDVYVYDSEGNLCGTIIDNEVDSSYDDLFMYVVGDEKYVYFMEDAYNVQFVGTDNGLMEYDVKTYEDGDLIRTLTFTDIPLNDGCTYTAYVPETVYSSNCLYELVNGNGESISSDIDTYQSLRRIYVSDITLKQSTLDMQVGDESILEAIVSPNNATLQLLEWESDSSDIVEIDSNTGKLVAKSIGTAVITATTIDGYYTAECKVTVSPVVVPPVGENAGTPNSNTSGSDVKTTSLKLTGISKKIAAGKKIALTPVFTPANVTNQNLVWTSSNTKYATVNNKGVVTTKKKGAGKTVKITVTAQDGSNKKATYKIIIMKHAVKSITLTAKSKTVKAGKKLTLKATVKTTGKKVNKTLKWTSSNAKYATVTKKGVVKTKKAGKGKTVKITAKATDGTNKKATYKIKIK